MSRRRPRVLLGITGSVAAVKTYELALRLAAFAEVKIVTTRRGDFMRQLEYNAAAASAFAERAASAGAEIPILTDEDEWTYKTPKSDPVLHIELRRWADVFVIAPLSANTLAKISGGLCDNLLTCVARAWEIGSKPLIVAPAMNTAMWEHPLTQPQIAVLRDVLRALVVDPVAQLLACGDVGVGAMASVDTIVAAVHSALHVE